MPHYYPVVFPAGRSLAGDSLGFHAYSFRVDNCTNQWYLEESTVSFIPPYSLGMCLRLYGTGVAILLAQAPVGQPQLAPIPGEQVVGVYSDQLRTEVAAAPIRNFSLIQTVSDFQQGPQPANPPNSTTRLWADAAGNLHILTPDGQDATIVDSSNATLGGDLYGTIANARINVKYNSYILFTYANAGQQRAFQPVNNDNYIFTGPSGRMYFWSDQPAVNMGNWDAPTNTLNVGGDMSAGRFVNSQAGQYYFAGIASGPRLYWDTAYVRSSANFYAMGTLVTDGTIDNGGNVIYWNHSGAISLRWDGVNFQLTHGLGIASGQSLYIGSAGMTNATAGGQQALMTNTGNGDFILGGGASTLYMHPNLSVGIKQNYPYLDVFGLTTIRVSSFYIANGTGAQIILGRNSIEVQATTHFYCAGSEYVVLDSSATSYTQRSSRKIKEGIVQLANDNAMARVRDTRAHPVTFRWAWHEWRKRQEIPTVPGSPAPRNQQVGFVAEDMQYVVPEAVSFDTTTGEASGINYGILTAVLWGAVRQLDQRLQAIGG